MRRDGYRCVNCRQTWNLQVDHITPYSLGGKTEVDNGQTMCGWCNRLKSNDWVG
jgi:5-methylcytosine-specific restriction endonuclease McrA